MRLAWIEIKDFRNHVRTAVEIPVGVTAVVGPNGHGKTNLLEAMYYLVALESPRVRSDLPLVRTGASSAFLRGEVVAGGRRFLVEVEVRANGQNRVQVNRSVIRRKRDLRRAVRGVFSGPEDLSIVQGEPDDRRRFMDEAVRTLWPMRDGVAAAYDRALRQRNRLLKEWDGHGELAGLEGWDAELIERGAALTTVRAEALAGVSPPAAEEFEGLAGEALRVSYRPSVAGEPLREAFAAALAARRGDELVRRTTLVGPHRDELDVALGGLAVRGFGSHGEAWAASLCLRLGLASAVGGLVAESPVCFLDDPFSGLDRARQGRLAGRFGKEEQMLIAVPDASQVPPGAGVWTVSEGRVGVA